MDFEIIELDQMKIARVKEGCKINTVQDSLDLMGNADYLGARQVIVDEKNLDPAFFDLRTGLAGEILQKYSNYRMKLAIIGEFTKFGSNALNAFIIECNRGNCIFFAADFDEALDRLIHS